MIASPVGPYYPTGFAPVSLQASSKYVRAFPGGIGAYKAVGNYAPGILPALEAARDGYSQVLWLGEGATIHEVGTMNFFALEKKADGSGVELITPPLDGCILPGVTRKCVIHLVREWGGVEVSERPYSMDDLVASKAEGRLLEVFGAGTAAIVSPVNNIGYKGEDIAIPLDAANPDAQAGPLTSKLMDAILDIQYGAVEGPEGWSVQI